MLISLTTLLATLSSIFRARATLQLENLALRHKIGVCLWGDWRSALAIVGPETVIAWHRAGFRLFWTRKVRRGALGRPALYRPAAIPDHRDVDGK